MEKILIKLVITIISAISPELKTIITNAIDQLEEKASKTPNVFDDMLVAILKELFK